MPKHTRIAQHPRRADRATRAAVLREVSSKMTPQQRLAVLDERLGVGRGAVKERIRLHQKMVGNDNVIEAQRFADEDVLFEGPAEPGEAPKRLKAKERRARDKKLSVRP